MMGIVGPRAGNGGTEGFQPPLCHPFSGARAQCLSWWGYLPGTTGAEALYSDLGHCGLKNILHLVGFCQDHFDTNYLGQAAWIINHPELKPPRQSILCHDAPLVHLCGHRYGYTGSHHCQPSLPISGSFTVISEATYLNLWPNVMIKYPTRVKGQLYIPSVNHSDDGALPPDYSDVWVVAEAGSCLWICHAQHVDDFHLAVSLFLGAQAPAVVQPAAHLLLYSLSFHSLWPICRSSCAEATFR